MLSQSRVYQAGAALTAARQAGNLRAEGLSLVRLGEAHQCMGLLEIAISLHQDGLAILSQTHNRWQYALAIRRLADAHRDQRRADDAAEQYQQALTILR